MFQKQTIRDVKLAGKTVLLRADYNVPIQDGRITDDYRIQQSLPTLQHLIEHKAKVVICSHLGRPDGRVNPAFSLFPVAKRLTALLPKVNVSFVDDTVGEKALGAVKKLKDGEIVLLENLRFDPREEKNDADFAKILANLADIFVQDGFGVVHRAHASTDAVTRYLPSVAGLLLEKEADTLTKVMGAPERPLTAIVGGAKIADKIEILNRFIEVADFVAIGGAMANTFLLAEGHDVAKSLVDRDELPLAKTILKKAQEKAKKGHFVFYLPQDVVVSRKIDSHTTTRIVDWRTHVASSIEYYPKHPPHSANTIQKDEMILDIGPFSASFIAGAVQLSNTVVWNGTLGVTEVPALRDAVGPFAHGTEVVVDALLGGFGHKPFTVVGGGDTVGYIENQGLVNAFGHVSTGGGASLELLSGRTLPGITALKDKKGVQ
jgi:phosphoglycerate kinase